MNKDQTQKILVADSKKRKGSHMVDLNGEYSPAVLAGILNVSPANIYQLQQQGRLPNTGSLRNALSQYVAYWKGKATNKGGSAHEIAIIRKSELDRAKVELTWLQVKKERGQLVDLQEFSDILAPTFLQIRSQLIAFSRKFPETTKEVDKLLGSWSLMGQVYCKEAEKSMEEFVDSQLADLTDLEEQSATPTAEVAEQTTLDDLLGSTEKT